MIANRYIIPISRGDEKVMIEEISIPEFQMIVNKKGAYLTSLIGVRNANAQYKKEVKLTKKTADIITDIYNGKMAEKKLIKSLKLKKDVNL